MGKNLIVRVTDEMHEKLAQMAQEMSAELPGHRVTIKKGVDPETVVQFMLDGIQGRQCSRDILDAAGAASGRDWGGG
jgi:hypothetical protein